MTNVEFKELLKEAFRSHILMKDRNSHTVNELLYMLRYNSKFSDLQGVNVSIMKSDGDCMCIPCLEAFVDIHTLSVWFDDDTVEFEVDEFENDEEMMKFNCITVYESEEE